MNLFIGDSHSNLCYFDNMVHLLCSAGSAKGLNNPNSISQYNKKIIEKVFSKIYELIIFNFGGVDIDFSYIHKYIDDPNIDYRLFNKSVIENYINFIKDNFIEKKIIILSVGLPVLDDENLKQGLCNAHINYLENQNIDLFKQKMENIDLPDIKMRTKITIDFNIQLKNYIENLMLINIKFLDITSFTYDTSYERIKDCFFTKIDHHNYDRNKFYTFIYNFCIKLFYK